MTTREPREHTNKRQKYKISVSYVCLNRVPSSINTTNANPKIKRTIKVSISHKDPWWQTKMRQNLRSPPIFKQTALFYLYCFYNQPERLLRAVFHELQNKNTAVLTAWKCINGDANLYLLRPNALVKSHPSWESFRPDNGHTNNNSAEQRQDCFTIYLTKPLKCGVFGSDEVGLKIIRYVSYLGPRTKLMKEIRFATFKMW